MSLAHTLEAKAITRIGLQLEDEFDANYKKVCPQMAPILEQKWIPIDVAITAIADKNLERFAEIKVMEDKIEAFRKYIYVAPDYKHSDKEFLLLMNSINSKFEEIFGDPSDTFRENNALNANQEKAKP